MVALLMVMVGLAAALARRAAGCASIRRKH
jgi:hypothetical protein